NVKAGSLVTSGGASFKVLLVPTSAFMPLETLDRIVALARSGATVIAWRGFAADVAGYADLDRRRAHFRSTIDGIGFGAADAAGVASAQVGRGSVLRGDHLEPL